MKFKDLGLKTKIMLSVCGPLVLAAILGIVSMININSIIDTDRWVEHTYKVINDAEKITGSAVDMETGMRGYLLAGSIDFLEPYQKGEKNTFDMITKLKETVNDNKKQVVRLESAASILRDWQNKVALPNIQHRQEMGLNVSANDMAQLIKKSKGKIFFDRFRTVMDAFIAEEESLMATRLIKSEKTIYQTRIIIISCMAATLVLGLFLALYVTADIQKQVGGEPVRIVEIAQNVAQGNLDIISDNSRLTGIHAALAEMVNSLKKIASDVNDVVGEVSSGKIDSRGDASNYRGGWRELITGINNTLDSLANHMDQIPSPFMIIDTEYNILSVNKTSLEWIGLSKDQVLGRKCYDMFRTTDCGNSECACARVLQSGVREKSQAEANPGGKNLFVTYTGLPIKNESGKIIAMLEVFVDQTGINREDWIKSGQNELNSKMSGELNTDTLSQNTLNFLAGYLNAQVGVFYLADDKETLRLVSSYAYKMRSSNDNLIKFGESMIGQAAIEKKSLLFTDVPDDHVNIDINSGLGISVPKCIYVLPIVYENSVLGVIGLAAARVFNDKEIEMLDRVAGNIAVNLNSARARVQLNELLEETQAQSEELQAQQEELQATNEALEQQAEELKSSEESLQVQQEELKASNEELTEKTTLLEKQKSEVAKSNIDLGQSREKMRIKAKQLAQATKYKTEFLANMSHELRTPLNSLLLLSKNLTRNKQGNLNKKQIQDAEIIYNSGTDLLDLINGILDLSKIESGKMIVSAEDVYYSNIGENINNMFRQILEEKDLKFSINIDKKLKEFLSTDQQKLEQIIKNLMSNAIKFTDKGTITLSFEKPDDSIVLALSNLEAKDAVAVSVSDTGHGIPEAKHQEIFEAFQQADGTIVRKYGGTGLGLSICREFAKMLGGEIHLKSTEGNGAVFTIYIAENLKNRITEHPENNSEDGWSNNSQESYDDNFNVSENDSSFFSGGIVPGISDDRGKLNEDDNVILIVEDDPNFAKILYDFCHEKGCQCIHAPDGESSLLLMEKFPISAVILDIKLPGISGWGVLKKIKSRIETRHIPVHIMSVEDSPENILKRGAIGYLKKPVTDEGLNSAFHRISGMISNGAKKLLVVEDSLEIIENLKQAFKTMDVIIQSAMTGEAALKMIQDEKFDCMILDLMLPDISGQDLLKKLEMIEDSHRPAVIIHTAKDLSDEECFELHRYVSSMVTKTPQSTERLVDEVALFLHTIVDKLPGQTRKSISQIHEDASTLDGKKIMIVDDDVRNIYSIISTLDNFGIKFIKAKDGQKALETLEKNPDVDLILMDIMMPVMDGYEAIRRIRKQPAYEKLPILALTAKGMKKDREQSFEAGATDYLMKPVDPDKLLSTIRVWLHS